MSRIGNNPIRLPRGVTLTVAKDNVVNVEGPKGALTQRLIPAIIVKVESGMAILERKYDQKPYPSFHGLYRSLLSNMVVGVSEGYKKTLELIGVGYKANLRSSGVLELNLGYSHNILFVVPEEIAISTEIGKEKNPLIHLEGIDKQLVGQVAAKIRKLRKVEPYKGKGIRFLGEQVRRKAGKSASK